VNKILLAITDDEILRVLKFNLSREEYYILIASSGKRAVELFEAERPDMVIADSSLTEPDALEICRRIRRHQQLSHVLIILLIARGEEPKFRKCLEWEADDYVLKPVDLQEMVVRIKAMMLRRSRGNGQSPLTGLPDQELVKKEIKRRIDWEEKFALYAVTLDHFRAYNEVYGFDLGDRAIQRLGRVLNQAKEESRLRGFFLGHMGADNFIVLSKVGHVERYCQEVIRCFEQLRPELFPQSDLLRGYIVTADKTGRMRRFSLMAISIGVIVPEQRSFKSAQEALEAARWAMRKAKSRAGSSYYLRKDGSFGLADACDAGVSKKILVVNDDSLSLRLLRVKLEREGYAVRTATTVQEAMGIVNQDPPDLIFLDETISEVDRDQTTSRLKKNARTASIPVVMVASEAGQGEWVAGADDYLVKPYSFEYLMGKVEKHLNRT
jgi:diguanylate cyclase (GGDEF)-like protein